MRAMDGGEGGIISLDKIRLVDGTFYMEEALVMGDLSGYAKGRWVRATPTASSLNSDTRQPNQHPHSRRRNEGLDDKRSGYIH